MADNKRPNRNKGKKTISSKRKTYITKSGKITNRKKTPCKKVDYTKSNFKLGIKYYPLEFNPSDKIIDKYKLDDEEIKSFVLSVYEGLFFHRDIEGLTAIDSLYLEKGWALERILKSRDNIELESRFDNYIEKKCKRDIEKLKNLEFVFHN